MAQTDLTFTGELAAKASVPVSGTVTQTAADGGAAQRFEVEGTLTADQATSVTFTVDGAQSAAKPPSDALRGFLQANAGIAAASVGIVAPLLIGLPNVRDPGLFQELRGLLFWMSVTVFVSVLAAIVLQVMRTTRYHGYWPKDVSTAVIAGIVLTGAPAVPGGFALHAALDVACATTVAVPDGGGAPTNTETGGDPAAAGGTADETGRGEPNGEPQQEQPPPTLPASGAGGGGQGSGGQ